MPLRPNRTQGKAPLTEQKLSGRISWFGGANDSTDSGHTANGMTTATPGIAVYDQATLGGYWKVTTPNGKTRVIQQTDIGPAPWTGRVIDFTYSALRLFGYSESNFPTNAVAHAVYLGKNKQAAIEKAGGNAVEAAEQITSGGETGESQGAGKAQNASNPVEAAGSLLEIGKDLVTGNLTDLGAKAALASLQIVKDVGVGMIDLIIAPMWHWNQRAVAFYSQVVIDPRKIGGKDDYQWGFIWTATFWGVGYALLWTEQEGKLKPVPVKRARLGSHVRRAQALPARRSLVRPKDVKERTPTKPPITFSTAPVESRGIMTATRPRQVRVSGSTGGRTINEQTSKLAVEQVGTDDATHDKTTHDTGRHTEPDATDTGGTRASGPKRGAPTRAPAKGAGRRGKA